MRKLSSHLSSIKRQRGYLKFDLPEVEYIYDDEGYIDKIVRSKETESHTLIENFMLTANEYVAKLLTKKAKQTMYRIHEEPDVKDLNKLTEMLRAYQINFSTDKNLNRTWQNMLDCLPNEKFHKVFDRLILRSMKKAKYSIKHIPHFGLGLQTYTHFTSPIRRLCDLVIHMQLKALVFKQSRIPHSDFRIFEWAGIATDREIIADEAERMMENKIITTYMKKRVGNQFKATIINLSNSSIFIELEEIPVRGVIKLSQLHGDYYEFDERKYLIRGKRKGMLFKLCDEIDVQLMSVNDEIVFDVVGVYKKKGK
jgi:ribonuclease R